MITQRDIAFLANRIEDFADVEVSGRRYFKLGTTGSGTNCIITARSCDLCGTSRRLQGNVRSQ
jgi:hypothetical protein